MTLVSTCIDSLKKLPRTGWMQRGVPAGIAETVSSHAFESSIISAVIAQRVGANVEKSMALALIHDVAECLVGDIPLFTSSRIGALKEEIESEAVRELGLPRSLVEMYDEWREQVTRESRIVKIAEKFATLLEARRLSKMGFDRVREIEESMRSQIRELLKEPRYSFLREAVEELASEEGVAL